MIKNKTWLFALMVGAAALTSACSDGTGSSSKGDIDEPESSVQYFLSTSATNLEVDKGSSVALSIVFTSFDSSTNRVDAVKTGVINAKTNSSQFTLSQTTLVTDDMGVARVEINGVAAGSDTIIISVDDKYGVAPLMINVKVKEVAVPTETEYNYSVKLKYGGARPLAGFAEVQVYPGKSCSQLVSTGMSASEVNNIPRSDIEADSFPFSDVESLKEHTSSFKLKEKKVTNYAVVAAAQGGNGKFEAYGCTDNMNRKYPDIIVELEDTYKDTPIVDPDDPDNPIIDPDPQDPNKPVVDYKGVYTLTSSFDALSLLPHAVVEDGKSVTFQEMLAGDWIDFSLNLLSNPEKELPNVLTKQILPLLTNAEWFHDLLVKIPTYGEIIASLLGNLDVFLEQFGIKKMIEDTLSKLTSNITWWGSATGAVEIVKNLGKEFTLYGSFKNNQSTLSDNKLTGVNHSYSSLLYHNGNFENCYVGKPFGKDVNNKTICQIDISTLDKDAAGSLKGNFTADFSEITSGVGTTNIWRHNLQLAYAKLIYAALLQILNQFVTTENNYQFTSMGDILSYYIGMGLVSLYNKDLPEDDASRISGVIGCDAVGYAAVGFINRWIGDSDKLGGFAQLISVFLQPTFLANACTTGVNKLNETIDNQLNNNGYLNVSSDKVIFSSDNCTVKYALDNNGNPVRVAAFGTDDHQWGSSAKDERCKWALTINRGEEEAPLTIDGHFWAYTNK